MDQQDLRSMDLSTLNHLVESLGEKPYRAKQIFHWIHRRFAVSFDEMTDIPKALREQLTKVSFLTDTALVETVASAPHDPDQTTKYLFQMDKNTIIESVLLRYKHGNTVCVSTQAGCRMGCRFCASAVHGLDRNLTAGEMVAQIYEIQKSSGERVSHAVCMGIGEPFDNYDNTLRFLRLLNEPEGLGISQRNMTVSTCGLAGKITTFAKEGLQVNLAVSLHAPNDELRKTLIPAAARNKLDDILTACRFFSEQTKRRVTYEYAMIAGVNDSPAHARELGFKVRHTLCHVNLIPVNAVEGKTQMGSGSEPIRLFAEILQKLGVPTTVRRTLGSDIRAACGQLRNYSLKYR